MRRLGSPPLWIPAFAGMTKGGRNDEGVVGMAKVWLGWRRCGWDGEGVVGMAEVWLEWRRGCLG